MDQSYFILFPQNYNNWNINLYIKKYFCTHKTNFFIEKNYVEQFKYRDLFDKLLKIIKSENIFYSFFLNTS